MFSPIFTHISSSGIPLSCHVSFPSWSNLSKSSLTNFSRSGTRATGSSLPLCPNPSSGRTLILSIFTLSATSSLNYFLSWYSPAMLTPTFFQRRRLSLSWCHVRPKASFIARANFAPTPILSLVPLLAKIFFLTPLGCLLKSDAWCVTKFWRLVPATIYLTLFIMFDLRFRAGELAKSDVFLWDVIFCNTNGCPLVLYVILLLSNNVCR